MYKPTGLDRGLGLINRDKFVSAMGGTTFEGGGGEIYFCI